jgi:hypothetical protein
MDSARQRDLSVRITSVRKQIAEVLPRLAHCVQLAPRINELTDAIGRTPDHPGGEQLGSRTPESMQAEIDELYRSFPMVQRQASEVLFIVDDLLERLPADSRPLGQIRVEIERLTGAKRQGPFFSFGKTHRDLEIIDSRLTEMLAALDSDRSGVAHGLRTNNDSTHDSEVPMLSDEGLKDQIKWEVVRNLGGGGQGIVDLVRRQGESAEYVRKRLKNIESPERRRRFEHELRAYRELSHKNIVRIVDFDIDPPAKQRPYVVTEYCHGGSLEDGKWKRGTIRQILEDFLQVCDGLAHAHDRGVIHRDIKPANIYLREDGTITIGDFGLCLFGDADERVTVIGEVAGSRWYCAPELGDGRLETVRPFCDVYSLGKLLYWMLTGRVFDREKHRDEEWRIGRNDLPLPIYELVNQLLDKMIVADPWKRYQSAVSVAEAVRGLLRIEAAGGHAIGSEIPQLCTFCANGIYEWVADPFKDHGRATMAAENFGVRMVGNPMWMILICPSCANVQLFRPDLAPEADKRWRRHTP